MKKNIQKTYKRKKEKKLSKRTIILLIITLVCICINISLIIENILTPKLENEEALEQKEQLKEQQKQNQETATSEEYQLSLLKQGTERDRMEYYCGQFVKYIEKKNYTKAYELLYPEFKQQYFPTIEDFTTYAQKTYPSVMVVTYDDIDRQGDIYIVTLLIDDAFATDKSNQFSQRIVLQESDYNKYVLSFQVI